jgi:hypothetical protein
MGPTDYHRERLTIHCRSGATIEASFRFIDVTNVTSRLCNELPPPRPRVLSGIALDKGVS